MSYAAKVIGPIAAMGLLVSISTASAQTSEVDLSRVSVFFSGAQVVSAPKIVDCTLSGGTETQCFSITVVSQPSNHTPGPWCPANVADGPDKAGIWLESGKVYDVDGPFLQSLAEFYEDDEWQLFDRATGKINVTDSLEACMAAARPDVDPQYRNHCVQCLIEYLPEGATQTYIIPLEPKPSAIGRRVGFAGSGIAANGVLLDGPAPTDAILGAYTIAPFDDCGGHVNPHAGYHYHAVTDCLVDGAQTFEHAPQIGFAMDGYAIFTHLLADGTAPTGLDRCNGHETDAEGYHYHAGASGSNAIIGCFSAEYGCHSDDPDAVCDATAPSKRP